MSKTAKNKKKPSSSSDEKKDTKPGNAQHLLQEELQRLQKELQEHKNKYLSLLAESENSRKRMQKEKTESTKFAISNTLADFIQPIDQFETALQCADQQSQEVKNWAIGFQMILEQLKASLAQQGIKPFTSLGKNFDPHYHEAMETLEDRTQAEGLITKEFVKGYMMYDRVLRPAKVQVIKHPQAPTPSDEENPSVAEEKKESND